jgi:hypothetical protein
MGMYEDVIDFLARVENPEEKQMNTRRRFTSAEAEEMRRDFPGVPDDFVAYLCEVGGGCFRECQFTVYGWLATPVDILGEGAGLKDPDSKAYFLSFGDDFCGNMSGFLPNEKWSLAEALRITLYGCPNVATLDRVDESFGQYIRKQILMGPNGEDLRTKW